MPPSEAQASLEALDKCIADKPHKVGHDFTAATKHLCAYRDELIARHRAAGDEGAHQVRAELERVNAVISTVLAGQFPLGPIPWDEIETARAQLAEIVADV